MLPRPRMYINPGTRLSDRGGEKATSIRNRYRIKRTVPIAEVSRIVAPIAENHGITRVSLFGSRARGDNRRNSDYDFCVAYSDAMTLCVLSEFIGDLEEALGRTVDVVPEHCMSDRLRDLIKDDMVLIYDQA